MKNIKKYLVRFITLLVIVSLAMTLGYQFKSPQLVGLIITVSLFALTGLNKRRSRFGEHIAGIEVEIWENDIEEAIFKDNTFLTKSKDVSEFVLGGRVVHKPQSGGPGSVVKNRSSLPAAVRQRTDTVNTYELDEYTSDPLFIPNIDTVQLSYDKRSSALGEDKQNLIQTTAENMLWNWTGALPSNRILRSDGVTYAMDGTIVNNTVTTTLPGATGTRKAIKLTDFQTVNSFLSVENRMFNSNMNSLVPSRLIPQIFPAGDIVTTTAMASCTEQERRNGIMYKAQGFDIQQRSTVLFVDASGNLKPPGSAIVSTDSEAILFWWGMAVERAMGDIKFFEKIGDPQFYGDIYSFLVMMGGANCRTNGEGILILASGLTS